MSAKKDRILFFTDLHLYAHGNDWRRVDDGIEVLEWVLQTCIDRGVDKVFFLGDFFHVRGYIYPTVLAKAYKVLKKFTDNGIEHYGLIGNHDMPHRDTTKDNCITTLDAHMEVIEQPMVFEGENHDFYWMPYVENPDRLRWAIDKCVSEFKGGSSRNGNVVTRKKEKPQDNKKKVLLGHLDIQNAYYHSNVQSSHGVNIGDLADFDLVLTGHYHGRQKIGDNCHYIGDPYQQNFGEANQDKFILLFDDGELEWIENTFSPKYMYLNSEEISSSIENNYVTIYATSNDNIADIREKAEKYNPRNVNIKVTKSTMINSDVNFNNDAKDVRLLLKEWVEKTASEDIYDKTKLYNEGIEIVNTEEGL